MSNPAPNKKSYFKPLPRGPLLIAGMYMLAGLLWITCSDLLLDKLIDNPQQRLTIGMLKGYGYVVATTLALFFAVRHLQRCALQFRDELTESEQAYRNLFENNPDPMCVVEARSLKFLAVNRAATRVYGYSADEFDELTLHDLLDADGGGDVAQLLGGTAADTGLRHGVSRHRRRDGRLLYVETSSYATQFEGGAANMVIAHDISRRVEIENDLRESKSRLRFAQQLAGFGTVEADIETGELTWSDEALRIYGFEVTQPPPDLAQIYARLESADSKIMQRRFERRLAGKTVPAKTQLRVRLDDGSTRHLVVHLGERQWQADGRTRLVAVLRDVTERKLIEQKLKNSVRHYRQLLELLPEALLVLVGREVRFANRAAQQLFGSRGGNGVAKTLIGVDFSQLIDGDSGADYETLLSESAAASPGPLGFHTRRYRRLNGEIFEAEGAVMVSSERAVPVSTTTRTLPTLQVVIRDLSSQRQLQDALSGANVRLQRMSSQLIRAGEAVRHRLGRELHDDVGQLLTFIAMTASALEKNLAGDEQENRAIALRAAATEALGKVRDLALMLRPPQLDAQGLKVALDVHLERFLQDSGVGFTLRWQGLDAAESAPRPDPDVEIALFRVVQEAVTNVVRHASATHVDIRIREFDGCVELKLIDDGGGFDVERTLSNTNTAGVLGMRERTLLLGGEFQLQSAVGVGTQLLVRLPRALTS